MIRILLSVPHQILTMVTGYRNRHVLWIGVFTDRASQVAPVVKSSLANAGGVRDGGSIPGSGRYPGGGHGSALQYSCLENPLNRGAWQVTIHGFAKSRIWLKQLGMRFKWQACKVLPKGSGLCPRFLVRPMPSWLLLFLFAWGQGDHR